MSAAPFKVVCASCHTKFHVTPALVRGKIVKFRCKRCKGPIEVDGTQFPRDTASDSVEPGATRAGASALPSTLPPPPPAETPSEPLFIGVSSRPSQVEIAESMRLSVSDGWEGALQAPPIAPAPREDSPPSPKPPQPEMRETPRPPTVVLTDRVLRPPPMAISGDAHVRRTGHADDIFDEFGTPITPPPTRAAIPAGRSHAPIPPSLMSNGPRGPATAPPTVVHQLRMEGMTNDAPWPVRSRWAHGKQRALAALLVCVAGIVVFAISWRQAHTGSAAHQLAADSAGEPARESPGARGVELTPPVAVPAIAISANAPNGDTAKTPSASDPAAPDTTVTTASRAARAGSARGRGGARSGRVPRATAAVTDSVPSADSDLPGAAASAAQAMADVMREREFDSSAAKTALDQTSRDAIGCRDEQTNAHFARFSVTFAPTGRVTSVEIEGGPLAGTTVGTCMVEALRATEVPAFSGAPVTVHKNLSF
jgi:hypothetical protein